MVFPIMQPSCWLWRSHIAKLERGYPQSCSIERDGGYEIQSESGGTSSPCLFDCVPDVCGRRQPMFTTSANDSYCATYIFYLLNQHVEVLGNLRCEAYYINHSVSLKTNQRRCWRRGAIKSSFSSFYRSKDDQVWRLGCFYRTIGLENSKNLVT